jgi:hypothetical protein
VASLCQRRTIALELERCSCLILFAFRDGFEIDQSLGCWIAPRAAQEASILKRVLVASALGLSALTLSAVGTPSTAIPAAGLEAPSEVVPIVTVGSVRGLASIASGTPGGDASPMAVRPFTTRVAGCATARLSPEFHTGGAVIALPLRLVTRL